MKITTQLLPRAALVLLIGTALSAHAQPEVDTSKWNCKFCEFDTGFSGDVEFGAAYLSDDSFKFGEYTGMTEQGGYAIANAWTAYRSEDADYFDLTATNLGLDSRSLMMEGGRQGSYRLHLRYDELPHNVSDTIQTPFEGVGSDELTLPPDWVDSGSTGGMTSLDANLRDAELATKRERLAVGAGFEPTDNWDLGVTVRRDTKTGTQAIGGAFVINAAQLIQPIDYVTDEVEAFVAYNREEWQLQVKYYASAFENENDSLRWENPFTPLAPGADSGELALAPDNEFHQFAVAGGYRFSDATNASAELAVGRMRQNEDFVDATTNPNLATNLPRDSLDGEVDTLNAVVKLTSRLTEKLRLNAAYRYDDRDNQTPQETYDWVSTDTFAASARENQPYSFTTTTFDVSTDYRLDPKTKLSVGLEHEDVERTLQEVDETRENTLWGKAILRADSGAQAEIKLVHAQRDVSDYEPVPETQPGQNPLLRKFNLADRTRNEAGLRISMTPGAESLSVGFAARIADDDYTESAVGLTDSHLLNISADVATMLSVDTSLHAFLDHQTITSKQAGSNAFSVPDWFADQTDTINTLGFGVQHSFTEKLDVGADLATAQSTGEIRLNAADFPDLTTNLNSLKIYATYQLRDGMFLRGAYWHENYDAQDWSLDGVEPDTVSNVLTLGDTSPSYDVDVVLLSLRYQF